MEDDGRRSGVKVQPHWEELLEASGLPAEAFEQIGIRFEEMEARLDELEKKAAHPPVSRWTEEGVAAILAAALLEGAILLYELARHIT